jgi:predicted membrane-bound spermidine synthase
MNGSPARTLVLSAVFFLSGGSALILETLLFRQAGLVLGNSVWASSLVLASFMAGLALGNGLAALRAGYSTRPLRAYAQLEIVVGLTGAGLVCLWPLLGPPLGPLFSRLLDAPLALNAARLAVAFVLMMIPASAMGATLPLLARAVRPRAGTFGRTIGWLYGVNTLGAVAGALAAEAILVGAIGVRGSALVAAALNLAAALAAFALAQRDDSTHAAPAPEGQPSVGRRILAAAFLCGMALLALEVIWFRFLALFVQSTSLAFALLLAVVLLGIGTGGLAAAAWLRRTPGAAQYVQPILLLAGALTLLTYAGFGSLGGLEAQSSRTARIFGLSFFLTFPVSLLSGASFTLLAQRAHPEGGSEARTAGALTLANTLGALVGSVLGGFVLLPAMGVERSLVALALAYLAIAGLVPASAPSAFTRRAWMAALALLAASFALFPFGAMERRYFATIGRRFGADGSRIVGTREGLTETLIYMRRDFGFNPPEFRLVTNGFSMSGTDITARRYMSLYAWWPAAVHEGLRRTLLISYGCGTTARALTQVPGVEHIDVVDISREILEASALVHPAGRNPLDDPRVRVHVEDGRQFLLATNERYDLITGEPPPPRAAGVVNLYTREYFRLLRSRLAPGGIVTYWLPVDQLLAPDTRAILGAFCDAFPDCSLWNGAAFNWMLVGTNGRATPAGAGTFRAPWNDAALGPALRGIGVETPEQLGALFIADGEVLRQWIGGAPPLTDDFPHRILHEVGSTSVRREVIPVYRAWANAGASGRRFAASPFVAAVWPETVRAGTAAYFRWQGVLGDAMLDNTSWQPPSVRGLAELDAVLTGSSLRTLALWFLGTTVEEQLALAERAARGERHEELLGLGALADRDYERAAESFARAGGSANTCRRAYALARAGRTSEVEALARARLRNPDDAEAGFWAWMDGRFGLGGMR